MNKRPAMSMRRKKLEPLPGDRCIAEIGDYSGLEIWQGQMHEFGPVDGSPMSDDDVTTLRDELTAYLEGRYGCTDKESAKLTSTVSIAASAAHASLAEPKEECASRSENMTHTTPEQEERGRILIELWLWRNAAATWALNAQSVDAIATIRAYDKAIAIVKGEA